MKNSQLSEMKWHKINTKLIKNYQHIHRLLL